MTIKIPLNAFKAVQCAISTEKLRYYICGVYIEDRTITATNGAILLTYDLWETPTGVSEPFILKVDPSEKALKPKNPENVFMHVDVDRLIIETFKYDGDKPVGNRLGVCGFEVIDGTFPEYKRIIPKNNGDDNVSNFPFNGDYISIMVKAAKIFNKTPLLRLVNGERESSPALVNFGHAPEMLGVIMPAKWA